MSVSYWFAKKFGILLVLLYLGAMAVLVLSYYYSGVADSSMLANYYPAGHSYQRTAKNRLVREILGIPASDEDNAAAENVDILSYTDDGAVIRLRGKSQETVPTNKVVKQLINRNSAELEQTISPVYGPLNALLAIHLKFMKGVEDSVGGGEEGSLRKLILPKVIISVIYLGLVFVFLWALKRVDRMTDYKAGYSLIYGALVLWPIAVIAVSVAGSNVVDVVRHLPGSYYFMRSYIVGAWAVMFAWPILVVALSLVDILKAALGLDFVHAIAHAAVLAAGLVSIPLVTVGIMFAILVCVMYAGYRMAKRVIIPESWQKYRKLLGK